MIAEMRAAALQARARGDHAAALHLWRTLLARVPDDWTLALELRQDAYPAGQYPDSDAGFRRAARLFPDAEWLMHYAALYSFHADDLDDVAARAGLILQRWPTEPRLHAIIADVARQRRAWDEAAAGFDRAHRLDPTQPHYPVKAEAARLYARLSRATWPSSEAAYATIVVNLDRNPERMSEMRRQFSNVALRRQPGVEGSRLPEAAVVRLTNVPDAPRGTLGCFLSHAAAWETLLAGPDRHALILEDDVIPLLDLPTAVDALNIPEGFDLCFVNDRMEPKCDAATATAPTAHPLADVMAAFHPDENAPGGDGYIVSRAGAAKLLAWIAEDGMRHDVDWRLIAYGMTPQAIEGIPAHAVARGELSKLSALIGRPDRLRAYALHPALIRTVGVGSDREDQNRLKQAAS